MKWLGICLAFGNLYEKAGNGNLIEPLDGGAERLLAVVKHISSRIPSKGEALLVSTAGYCRQSPLDPEVPWQISLAHQAARFWQENCLHRNLTHFATPLCWSTQNEIRVGIKVALRGFASSKEPVTVVIASHVSHHERIRMYLDLYLPRRWDVVLLPVGHKFTLTDRMLEIAKRVRDTWGLSKTRRRLRRYKSRPPQTTLVVEC